MSVLLDDEHRMLRQRIDEATEGVPDLDQLGLIAALAREYLHSIQLVVQAVLERRETWAFNCHAYTFGLRDYVTRTAFPTAAYVTSLMRDVLIETEEPEDGDFVVYFKKGSVAHSGVWSCGRVRSKWGTGHVWEHALHEVPLRYGDEVRFFRAVPAERCIEAFAIFARTVR